MHRSLCKTLLILLYSLIITFPKLITIQISERSLSYWNVLQTEYNENEDGTKDKWTVATGERVIYVGTASDNLPLSETVAVK